MFGKRGVIRTDAIENDTRISASPRDSGAMSGLLTGLSFIAGEGGGVALADSLFPRPGSEPAEVSRYFTENSIMDNLEVVQRWKQRSTRR
jgi:hypothetical protein